MADRSRGGYLFLRSHLFGHDRQPPPPAPAGGGGIPYPDRAPLEPPVSEHPAPPLSLGDADVEIKEPGLSDGYLADAETWESPTLVSPERLALMRIDRVLGNEGAMSEHGVGRIRGLVLRALRARPAEPEPRGVDVYVPSDVHYGGMRVRHPRGDEVRFTPDRGLTVLDVKGQPVAGYAHGSWVSYQLNDPTADQPPTPAEPTA